MAEGGGPGLILGIPDPMIVLGYALAIGLALLCILYGLLAWTGGRGGGGD
jgi:hypothetical protein